MTGAGLRHPSILSLLLFAGSFTLGTALPSRTEELSAVPADLAEASETLRNKVSHLETRLRLDQQEVERQRRQNDTLLRQLEATQAERNAAERDRLRERFRVYSLEARLEQDRERLQEAEAALLQTQRELAATREEIGRLNSALDWVTRLEAEVPPPDEPPTPPASRKHERIRELERDLDLERERRMTLEREVERLTRDAPTADRVAGLSEALHLARAEIFLLNNRLLEEIREREILEVAIERARRAGDFPLGTPAESLAGLASALRDRRLEAERLREELRSATEIIVRLKGRLEAAGVDENANGDSLSSLEDERRELRERLARAEELNRTLRGKAELAERLAEMLYAVPDR